MQLKQVHFKNLTLLAESFQVWKMKLWNLETPPFFYSYKFILKYKMLWGHTMALHL